MTDIAKCKSDLWNERSFAVNQHVRAFIDMGIIPNRTYNINELRSGTTDGQVYVISENNTPLYTLKYDHPNGIEMVERFFTTYAHIDLFPKVFYVDPEKHFFLYDYIEGHTHVNRGLKSVWMKRLVQGLFNHYEKVDASSAWGRLGGEPRQQWFDFNMKSLEYAHENIGYLLPNEDYVRMKGIVERLAVDESKEEKYYLHGDTGVHNFVFHHHNLVGVIDPSPMVGPVLYDFTYAFCSSPDNLSMETLLSSFSLLENVQIPTSRLIEEVVFQLYTRIGICKKVHPHDLEEYLNAWDYWKRKI
ncbi:hypothetical protein [Sporosarcina sp. OR05]|uniref:hypothetical protein n=1 Tax=Sporosarcina sp. OR05 TaxID=2969819 RepID=UPI00352ABB17